jgi:hypothetical protein
MQMPPPGAAFVRSLHHFPCNVLAGNVRGSHFECGCLPVARELMEGYLFLQSVTVPEQVGVNSYILHLSQ